MYRLQTVDVYCRDGSWCYVQHTKVVTTAIALFRRVRLAPRSALQSQNWQLIELWPVHVKLKGLCVRVVKYWTSIDNEPNMY